MDKLQLKERLNSEQDLVNQLYEREGLTPEVLNKQIEINKMRNEYDIHDKSETVHEDYVQ